MKTLLFTMLLFGSAFQAHAEPSYYEPFFFHVQGDCSDRAHLWFHQSSTWFRTDLGRDAEGRVVYADITLQLFRGGRYWLDYSEVAITNFLPDGGTVGIPVFHKRLVGDWGVHDANLFLVGLLNAQPYEIHDHGGTADGLLASFTSPIHDPRLVSRPVVFGAMYSKLGPKGMSVAQFCHH